MMRQSISATPPIEKVNVNYLEKLDDLVDFLETNYESENYFVREKVFLFSKIE